MKNCKQLPIKVILFFTISLSILLSVGCGTVKHSVDLQEDYAIKTDAKIEVGEVTNGTGLTFDIDIEKLLADALEESLREEKLLSTIPGEPRLIITSKIVEYKQGDAFKRWLMPGWGSTVLMIECDLMDANDLIGSVKARRTVDAGGGYTIGAWKTIFREVSKDIAKDLRKKIDCPKCSEEEVKSVDIESQ
jgi:hypothetical protein